VLTLTRLDIIYYVFRCQSLAGSDCCVGDLLVQGNSTRLTSANERIMQLLVGLRVFTGWLVSLHEFSNIFIFDDDRTRHRGH